MMAVYSNEKTENMASRVSIRDTPPLSLLKKKSVFTSGSGTRSWPACQSGWGMLPVPFGPGRLSTSGARSCALIAPVDGP